MGRRALPSLMASAPTRCSRLQYLHQQEDSIPDIGIPFLFGAPAPVNHRAYYGLPADDRFQTEVDVVTGKVDAQFRTTSSRSATQCVIGSYWFDSRQTNPNYGSANCFTSTTSPFYYTGGTLCASLSGTSDAHHRLQSAFSRRRHAAVRRSGCERDRPSVQGHDRHR